jgi:hypothetical protein
MKSLKNVLIVFAIVAIAVMFTGCPAALTTGPEPPQTETKYTLQIQYIRPYLLDNPLLNGIGIDILDLSQNDYYVNLAKVGDDYHFYGEAPGIEPCPDYYIRCCDNDRYDGEDFSSSMVGDIFIITVKETGFVKELLDIRPYTLPTNPYPGPLAKAAFFKLTSDGTIISSPQ